jgi:hypothetical protein
MYFPNKHLSSLLALISALMVGHQAVSQSAIPDDKCAIITGATKDPEVALQAIKKFQEFGNPVVVQSSNGFLAPSIGLYYKDGSKELVKDFKKDKIIPDDSYCGNADRFVSVLYPNQNFTALTTNPPSLIARYGYVGKWSADPNDCGITEYETDSIYFDENSVTFATKSCDVKDQQVSPVNSLGLIIEMSCFEEGEQYDDVLSLILQAKDKILIPDTDLEYTKCAQLDESPIVATENRLTELEERELAVLDKEARLKNFEKTLESLENDFKQRKSKVEDLELVLLDKEAKLKNSEIRLESAQKDLEEKSKDLDLKNLELERKMEVLKEIQNLFSAAHKNVTSAETLLSEMAAQEKIQEFSEAQISDNSLNSFKNLEKDEAVLEGVIRGVVAEDMCKKKLRENYTDTWEFYRGYSAVPNFVETYVNSIGDEKADALDKKFGSEMKGWSEHEVCTLGYGFIHGVTAAEKKDLFTIPTKWDETLQHVLIGGESIVNCKKSEDIFPQAVSYTYEKSLFLTKIEEWFKKRSAEDNIEWKKIDLFVQQQTEEQSCTTLYGFMHGIIASESANY